jgi:hypothetical protein
MDDPPLAATGFAIAKPISVAKSAQNDTHALTCSADTRLYRKGARQEVELYFIGYALIENRNAVFVDRAPEE